LSHLKPRIERMKERDKERYGVANKLWARAMEAQPTSETQCLSYELRARRALTEPLEEVKNCDGPNARLARCAKVGKAEEPGVGAGSTIAPRAPDPPAMLFLNPIH
jgi:hypothetical protein